MYLHLLCVDGGGWRFILGEWRWVDISYGCMGMSGGGGGNFVW